MILISQPTRQSPYRLLESTFTTIQSNRHYRSASFWHLVQIHSIMDQLITMVIREALRQSNLIDRITIQSIGDRIWLRDDLSKPGARWCIIKVKNTKLIIGNGTQDQEIDLNHPESIKILSVSLKEAIETTRLFTDQD